MELAVQVQKSFDHIKYFLFQKVLLLFKFFGNSIRKGEVVIFAEDGEFDGLPARPFP